MAEYESTYSWDVSRLCRRQDDDVSLVSSVTDDLVRSTVRMKSQGKVSDVLEEGQRTPSRGTDGEQEVFEVPSVLSPCDVPPHLSVLLLRMFNARNDYASLSLLESSKTKKACGGEHSFVSVTAEPKKKMHGIEKSIHTLSKIMDKKEEISRACCHGKFRRKTKLDRLMNNVSSFHVAGLAQIRGEERSVFDRLHKMLHEIATQDESAQHRLVALGGLLRAGLATGSLFRILTVINIVLGFRQIEIRHSEDYDDSTVAHVFQPAIRTFATYLSEPISRSIGTDSTVHLDVLGHLDRHLLKETILDRLVIILFAHLDRVFWHHDSVSFTDDELSHAFPQIRPFVIELSAEVIQLLLHLINTLTSAPYLTKNSDGKLRDQSDDMSRALPWYCVVVCVRLLGINLRYLSELNKSYDCSLLETIFVKLQDVSASGSTTLSSLRQTLSKLLRSNPSDFSKEVEDLQPIPRTRSGSHDASSEPPSEKHDHESFQHRTSASSVQSSTRIEGEDFTGHIITTLQNEAAKAIGNGFLLFYPSFNSQRNLVFELIDLCSRADVRAYQVLLRALFTRMVEDRTLLKMFTSENIPVVDRKSYIMKLLEFSESFFLRLRAVGEGEIDPVGLERTYQYYSDLVVIGICKDLWTQVFSSKRIDMSLVDMLLSFSTEIMSKAQRAIRTDGCMPSEAISGLLQLMAVGASLLLTHIENDYPVNEAMEQCFEIVNVFLPPLLNVIEVIATTCDSYESREVETVAIRIPSEGHYHKIEIPIHDADYVNLSFSSLELPSSENSLSIHASGFHIVLDGAKLKEDAYLFPMLVPAKDLAIEIYTGENEKLKPDSIVGVVTPITKVHPCVDCHRTLCLVAGRAAGMLVRGQPLCERELIMKRMVTKDFMRGGKEQKDDHRVDAEEVFLNEILRDTGKGGAYFRETFRRGFQGGIVLQENERVNLAMRHAVATCLKHCGIVKDAMMLDFESGSKVRIHPTQLEVLARVGGLRVWMIEQKQLRRETHELSYDTFSEGIQEKASFLFHMHPGTSFRGERHDKNAPKKEDTSKETEGKVPNLKVWGTGLTVLKAVILFKRTAKGSERKMNYIKHVIGDLIKFLKDRTISVGDIASVIDLHRQRALSRRDGLRHFSTLLGLSNIPENGLFYLGVAMHDRLLKSIADGRHHVLANVELCGTTLSEHLRREYHSIISKGLSFVSSANVSLRRSRRLSLSLALVNVDDDDIQFYVDDNMMDKVHDDLFPSLICTENPESCTCSDDVVEAMLLKDKALELLRFLAGHCMRDLNHPSFGCRELLMRIFNMLLNDLESLVKRILVPGKSPSSCWIASFMDVTSLLFIIAPSPSIYTPASSAKCVDIFNRVFRGGNTKMRSVTSQLCRVMLSRLAFSINEESMSSIKDLLLFFFQVIGESFFMTTYGKFDFMHHYEGRLLVPQLLREMISLVRDLSDSRPLEKVFADVVQQALGSVSRIAENILNRAEGDKIHRYGDEMALFGILTSFCGIYAPFKDGDAVLFDKENGKFKEGTIARYFEETRTVRVRSNESVDLHRGIENIFAKDERPKIPDWLTLDEEILFSLASLCQSPVVEHAQDCGVPLPMCLTSMLQFLCLKFLSSYVMSDCADTASLMTSRVLAPLCEFASKDVNKSLVDAPLGLVACTYDTTGRNFVPQIFYHCRTCRLLDQEGMCAFCAMTCHRGHDIVPAKLSTSFCDCGANPHKHKCLSTKARTKRTFIHSHEMERLTFLMGEVTDLHSRHKITAPPRRKESTESDDASEVTRDLMTSGFSHDLVVDALRRHSGDANCALSWLKRKGADGMRERKADELSGMGFAKAACIRALLMCGDDMNQAGAWLLDHADDLASYDGADEALSFLSDNDEHGFDRSMTESEIRDSVSFSCMQLGSDYVCVPKSLDDVPSVRPGALVSVLEYAERTSSKQYSREMLGKYVGRYGVVVKTLQKRSEVVFLMSSKDVEKWWIKNKYLYIVCDTLDFSNSFSVRKEACRLLSLSSILHIQKAVQGMLQLRPPPDSVVSVLSSDILHSLHQEKRWHDLMGPQHQFWEGGAAEDNLISSIVHSDWEGKGQYLQARFSESCKYLDKYAIDRFHIRVEESGHPISEGINTRVVRFWGADAILIVFHPKTHIPGSDSLELFTNSRLSQRILCNGRRMMIVPGTRFWFRFNVSSPSLSWGFRFVAVAMRYSVANGLVAPPIPKAVFWLRVLRTLIVEGKPLPVNISKFMNSAIMYAVTPHAPYRIETCRILADIAEHMGDIPPEERFSLDVLKHVRIELERVFCDLGREFSLVSGTFQAVAEVMVRVRQFLVSDLCSSVFDPHVKGRERHLHSCPKCGDRSLCFTCVHCCHSDHATNYLDYRNVPCSCKNCVARSFRWEAEDSKKDRLKQILFDQKCAWPYDETPKEFFDHASWFDRMYQVVVVMQCFHSKTDLPGPFMMEAWLETQKKIIVRETAHPYSTLNEEGFVRMSGAKNLAITFDKRSVTDRYEFVLFSSNERGKDDLGRYSGEELANRRFVVNGDHFYYSFMSEGFIHEGVRCDSCGTMPILGVRYKCTVCEDYDLCEKCFVKKEHDPSHIFLCIRRPGHLNPAHVPCLYPEGWRSSSIFRGNTHVGIRCSHCGLFPVVGVRYRCENCPDYNLCEKCGKEGDQWHDRQHCFLIVERPLPPESQLPTHNLPYGLLYRKERDTFWGFSFTVSPAMTKEEVSSLFEESAEQLCQIKLHMDEWTSEMDLDLVRFVNQKCEKGWVNMQPVHLNPRRLELIGYPRLQGITLSLMRSRFVVLKMFNAKLSSLLPLIDVSVCGKPSKLGEMARMLSGLIFYDVKLDMWNRALTETTSDLEACTVYVNRHVRAKMSDEPTAIRARYSLFEQLYRQLGHVSSALLRKKDRSWRVLFVSEGADDYGGPYRESLTDTIHELQDKEKGTSYLMPTPNARSGIGQFLDLFMPNFAYTSREHLLRLTFLGKLMGIAIRSHIVLPLNLASLVWKPLVGQTVGKVDLQLSDTAMFNSLERIERLAKECSTDAEFEKIISQNFTAYSSAGESVELRPNGKNISVTRMNASHYVEGVLALRQKECMEHVQAISEGLCAVVPGTMLPLFQPDELEHLICGEPVIDIDVLSRHTVYDGYNARSPVIINFWRALSEFSPHERSMFLRFVSGWARLPLTEAGFDRSMKIQLLERPYPDECLPQSHTCFFSLELPRYSSYEILREKLAYAVVNCTAVDTDYTQSGDASRNLTWDVDDDTLFDL